MHKFKTDEVVRCINAEGVSALTKGMLYRVFEGQTEFDDTILLKIDNEIMGFYASRFELYSDSMAHADAIEALRVLAPEPRRFVAGDRVRKVAYTKNFQPSYADGDRITIAAPIGRVGVVTEVEEGHVRLPCIWVVWDDAAEEPWAEEPCFEHELAPHYEEGEGPQPGENDAFHPWQPPYTPEQRAKLRKMEPVGTLVTRYFPDAMRGKAAVAWVGNEKHRPGQELGWTRGKSADHIDALMRHAIDGARPGADGWDTIELPDGRIYQVRHAAAAAWRADALAQLDIESVGGEVIRVIHDPNF